jgi:hypothetical protein
MDKRPLLGPGIRERPWAHGPAQRHVSPEVRRIG